MEAGTHLLESGTSILFFDFAKLVSTNLLSPFPSFRDGAMFVKSFLVFNEIPFNEQPVRSLNGLRMLT